MKTTRLELIFLGLIILLGSFLRLYRIRETAMFLGDQGRDAIIVKNIIKNNDIALIGPVTSVGNMYLGPAYYYFMAPWLAVSYPDPIGPAIAVALIGIATIPLVYFIAKKIFHTSAAVFAASMFSVSSIVVQQVRFSWNPNLAPTIGLLIFYFVYEYVTQKKPKYIIWLAGLFSFIAQLHYMALLLGVFIVGPIIYEFITNKSNRSKTALYSILGILVFIFSLVPLIIFDQRHDHLIKNSFGEFFTSSENHLLPTQKVGNIIGNMSGSLYKVLPQMVGSYLQSTHLAIVFLCVVALVYLYKTASKKHRTTLNLFILWFTVSAIFMSLYSSSIFIHYLSYSQAVSIMFIGVLLGGLYQKLSSLPKRILIVALILFTWYNLKTSPAFGIGLSNIDNADIISQSIYQRVKEDELYNIVLISGTGDIDAQNYRYFLETTDRPPVLTERRGEVETLFIIQEDYFDTRPVDSPIYEIVVFPNKNPSEVYTIPNGPTVTVLRK